MRLNIKLVLISFCLAGIVGIIVVLIGTPPNQSIERYVMVDASVGFQQTSIKLKDKQTVLLEPEGHIHLALNQISNFAKLVKPLIIKESLERNWSDEIKNRYPLPLDFTRNENNVFYRAWVGPEGDTERSDILEECKLRKDLPWGTLLAIVIPSNVKVSAQSNPLEVLTSNNLNLNELEPVSSNRVFTAKRDGWLTFIVNEAVISPSPYSLSKDSQDYYKALKQASQKLSNNARQTIPQSSIPLVFFSDNLGAFHVKVSDSK